MSVDISVVIPTFRRPKPLGQTIASVLGQTGVSVEVIVVDDSPEASAQGVVEGFGDARVQYVKNPAPSGGMPGMVRNLGWPLAQGDFIHFLDDDDLVPDGHYAAVTKIFAERSDVGVVFGQIEPFGDAPEQQMQHERAYFASAARRAKLCSRFGARRGFAAGMLFGPSMLVCSDCVVRRTTVQQVGGFDPRMRLCEDAAFYTFAMRHSGAYFMDRVSLKFRVSNPSMMHSIVQDPMADAHIRETWKLMHARYRAEWGALEFYGLKILARAMLR